MRREWIGEHREHQRLPAPIGVFRLLTNWRHGKQHGHAVEYSDKNKTWEADYADGKVLRGERREYFGNGELRQITNYENDARHGRFWRRIDEITEVEGQFEKGWPTGLWKRRVFQTKDDKKVLLKEESFDCATQRGDEVLEYLVNGFKDEAKQQLGF